MPSSLENLSGTYVPVVFISYYEPNAIANLVHLKETMKVEDALSVHGVKGLDAAHKAASEVARSYRPDCPVFFTIDGDNQVGSRFNELRSRKLGEIENKLPFKLETGVVSFRAVNLVNGSCYGNGGVKLWSHEFVAKMQTHETREDGNGPLDFCELPNYMHQPDVLSRTIPVGSPAQAFRAGYREGAKLLVLRNASPLRSLDDFTFRTVNQWASIGTDVRYGAWCCIGTVYGIHDGLFNPEVARKSLVDHDLVSERAQDVVRLYGPDNREYPANTANPAYAEFLETYCKPLARAGYLLGSPFSHRRSYWTRKILFDALGES